MNLFNYLMAKKGHNTSVRDDLFAYLLGKRPPKEVKTATGTTISISDATREKIVSLTLSKESTQDGTPTPDNPVEVKTVKGYRNLFDKANYTSGKWIGQSGSISNDSNFGYSDYIEIKSSTSYFLSGLANGGGTHPGFCFYDTTYTYISGEENNGRTSILITTPLNAKYIRFSFKKVDLDTIQLVEGTERLPYVPYGTNWIYTKVSNGTDTNYYTIPLNDNEIAGIGNYKDELIVDKNGKCWLNKKIGKTIFNGNETWATPSAQGDNYYRFENAGFRNTSLYKPRNVYLSNRFIFGGHTSGATKNCITSINSLTDNRLWLFIDINIIGGNTVDKLKSWLSTHNADVYYILATPEPIDLNYTVDIRLFNGVNNISNSDDMDMTLKYY